jgi:hypothetical protein
MLGWVTIDVMREPKDDSIYWLTFTVPTVLIARTPSVLAVARNE